MISLLLICSVGVSGLHVENLQCESWTNPVGIDVSRPNLSWIVTSPEKGQKQTAYQIQVATTLLGLKGGKADLWDSGKVQSSETLQRPYKGKPLQSTQQAFWRVRSWDFKGHPSDWSTINTWTTHLLNKSDWKAKWIAINTGSPSSGNLGFHAQPTKDLDAQKWVQVDLGAVRKIEKVSLFPVRFHDNQSVFAFPKSLTVQYSNDQDFRQVVASQDLGPNIVPPSDQPVDIKKSIQARYVRVLCTKMSTRHDGVGCFAISELQVISGGKNVALGAPVTALDSVEDNGWTKLGLTDGSISRSDPSSTFYARKEITIPKRIRRALCFVTGVGQYEMRINGAKVGNDWLTPGWTQYKKTTIADSYDVTKMLRSGKNALALHVGNGFYDMSGDLRGAQTPGSLGASKAICQLQLEYVDGTRQLICTDGSWKVHTSPSTYSGVYGGEDWDARNEQIGWDGPNFKANNWKAALVVAQPSESLVGLTHSAPPVRVIEVRKSVNSTTPRPNLLVLDLGQNAPYIPEIKVMGAAGSQVRLWPAEWLNPDGTVNQNSMRAGKHVQYTLKGGTAETWHPTFWYTGCRYWQVEATDQYGRVTNPRSLLVDFKGLLVHSSAKPVGDFECSNNLFNKTHEIIRWAMRSNMVSILTDCPHREKSGWLEQDHLVGAGLMYTYDMSTLFRKTVQDIRDTQQPNGMVPTMAPEYFIYADGFRDSIEWGGTYLLLPRFMRDWYADGALIREHYPTMKRYVDYLHSRAKHGILSNGLGDWDGDGTDPRTPVAITDTAYLYYLTKTLSEFAKTSGHAADSAKYAALALQTKQSFNIAFLSYKTGKIGTIGSQSSQATALDLGLIDNIDKPKVFAQLLADLDHTNYAISAGEVGHPAILHALTQNGRADLVAKIHGQSDKPGYGYQIKNGMTTLGECWDGKRNSLNHFMLGHIMEWFYGELVGIKPDPTGTAFSKIEIKPHIVPGVTWAKASYDSIRGRIECSWKLEDGHLKLDLVIPANTTATVWLPTSTQYVPHHFSSGHFKIDTHH